MRISEWNAEALSVWTVVVLAVSLGLTSLAASGRRFFAGCSGSAGSHPVLVVVLQRMDAAKSDWANLERLDEVCRRLWVGRSELLGDHLRQPEHRGSRGALLLGRCNHREPQAARRVKLILSKITDKRLSERERLIETIVPEENGNGFAPT